MVGGTWRTKATRASEAGSAARRHSTDGLVSRDAALVRDTQGFNTFNSLGPNQTHTEDEHSYYVRLCLRASCPRVHPGHGK